MATKSTNPQTLLRIRLDPVAQSAALGRKVVRDVLAACPRAQTETVLLVASELVTNAVQHAHTPLRLEVTAKEHTLTVAVTDGLPDDNTHMKKTSSTSHRENGRGLVLIDALCESWGITRGESSKSVWANIAPEGDPGPGSQAVSGTAGTPKTRIAMSSR